mmetsp:Transcript_18973/g.48247  ORF Transcript_18973/g.48247 Transcript_18973/m.48247 type:complete len:260 (+) Transcript_18973:434-1213(+)
MMAIGWKRSPLMRAIGCERSAPYAGCSGKVRGLSCSCFAFWWHLFLFLLLESLRACDSRLCGLFLSTLPTPLPESVGAGLALRLDDVDALWNVLAGGGADEVVVTVCGCVGGAPGLSATASGPLAVRAACVAAPSGGSNRLRLSICRAECRSMKRRPARSAAYVSISRLERSTTMHAHMRVVSTIVRAGLLVAVAAPISALASLVVRAVSICVTVRMMAPTLFIICAFSASSFTLHSWPVHIMPLHAALAELAAPYKLT